MGPGDLSAAVRSLNLGEQVDPNLLVGVSTLDDAGVYRLSDTLALVQTVDFITPIVDDPFTFGQIAAANSLSDIWAMGGEPTTALNIVCFPSDGVGREVLAEILAGGLAKLREAGVALLGGHSVADPEIKYGLAVTGMVEPARIWTNAGAQPGDALVLTKPLGTGIISTALKSGLASEESVDAAIRSMTTLNCTAKRQADSREVHSCTDITGFGLLGHLSQLARASAVSVALDSGAIPLLPEALELARQGVGPGGMERNRTYAAPSVTLQQGVDASVVDILYDAQTSGGLLLVMPPADARGYIEARHESGEIAALIGVVGRQSDAEATRIDIR